MGRTFPLASRLASLLSACTVAGAAVPSVAQGIFSRAATSIWSQVGTRDEPLVVMSPDRRSFVSFWRDADDETIRLRLGGRLGRATLTLNPAVNAELEWSPDSQAFFITASDGGSVGDYHALVYAKQNSHLLVRDLSALIANAFGNPVRCFQPEKPNIGGIAWLRGHERLLLAAEIQPHSNCDSMGTFKAYQVDLVNMRILDSYDQLVAKRRYGSLLGKELISADDRCVRNAQSCYIPQLHVAP